MYPSKMQSKFSETLPKKYLKSQAERNFIWVGVAKIKDKKLEFKLKNSFTFYKERHIYMRFSGFDRC